MTVNGGSVCVYSLSTEGTVAYPIGHHRRTRGGYPARLEERYFDER